MPIARNQPKLAFCGNRQQKDHNRTDSSNNDKGERHGI
jgi:hypothetical protein